MHYSPPRTKIMNLENIDRLQAPQHFLPAAGRLFTRGRATPRRVVSTIAFPNRPVRRILRTGSRKAAGLVGSVVRESGIREHWRFILVMIVVSFLTAWLGTKAIMSGVDESLSRVAIASALNENTLLRARQETLREQTDVAIARLSALETTYARHP
jgi:hypothetical protein